MDEITRWNVYLFQLDFVIVVICWFCCRRCFDIVINRDYLCLRSSRPSLPPICGWSICSRLGLPLSCLLCFAISIQRGGLRAAAAARPLELCRLAAIGGGGGLSSDTVWIEATSSCSSTLIDASPASFLFRRGGMLLSFTQCIPSVVIDKGRGRIVGFKASVTRVLGKQAIFKSEIKAASSDLDTVPRHHSFPLAPSRQARKAKELLRRP